MGSVVPDNSEYFPNKIGLLCYWLACRIAVVMSKSQIINHIGGYLPLLARVVRNGFTAIDRQYSETTEVHSNRTRASIRHDHMVRAALEMLPREVFRLVRVGQRNLFSYRGILLLQFKKLKPSLTTSNYPTHQAELFNVVGEIAGLPGIGDPMPLLSVGYVARPAHGLEGIYMSHIVNRQPAWVERLDDDSDEQQPPIISILSPNDPITPPPSRIRRPHILRPDRTGPAEG